MLLCMHVHTVLSKHLLGIMLQLPLPEPGLVQNLLSLQLFDIIVIVHSLAYHMCSTASKGTVLHEICKIEHTRTRMPLGTSCRRHVCAAVGWSLCSVVLEMHQIDSSARANEPLQILQSLRKAGL